MPKIIRSTHHIKGKTFQRHSVNIPPAIVRVLNVAKGDTVRFDVDLKRGKVYLEKVCSQTS